MIKKSSRIYILFVMLAVFAVPGAYSVINLEHHQYICKFDNKDNTNENVNLKQEVLDIAAKYPMLGIKLLIIDTERKFIASGFGKELAEAANGKYVQLPKATDKAIAAMALNAINEF